MTSMSQQAKLIISLSAELASKSQMEPPLPGFESFTAAQMLWISYGQVSRNLSVIWY